METCDFLVIGAGIIGLAVASELKERHPDASIILIDKEDSPGRHATGRNSGVLHAGFYYSADSLKARFTRSGNLFWTEFCRSRSLPFRACGKLVVAARDEDAAILAELLKRGQANGVPLHLVDEKEAFEIEPRAKTSGKALYSPSTAVVDPLMCSAALAKETSQSGIDLRWNCGYRGRRGRRVDTTLGAIETGFVVNAAGLYADRIASDFGFCAHYRILPFKGLYLLSEEAPGAFRTHIYPAPDARYPFLGVHFTVTVDGRVKIGPTAIPALWRENYSGLSGFSFGEFAEIALRQTGLLLASNPGFRNLAWREIQKNSRRVMVGIAAGLAQGVKRDHFRSWGKPGIRAQLFDLRTQSLVMDFVLEGDSNSLHILNAVSPGFTCAIPFAAHIVDQIGKLSSGRAPQDV